MATINGSTSTSYWTFKLEVTEGTPNIANNTSPVTVGVYIGRHTVGSYMYGAYINCTVSCTGVSNQSFVFSNSSQIDIDAGEWYRIGTVTFPAVPHNADGSKTVTVGASFTNNIYPSSGSASGSVTLTTIARASQPSLVTWPENTQDVGNFGDTISIFMNRASSSFTHTVRYEFGSLTGTIATGVTNDCQWTIPLSFMNLLPEATEGSGRVYVDTYNGSTLIGTKYSGFTATVPASVKPSCTLTLDDVNGIDNVYGKPVKGLSKINIKVNATLAYSSPIASYKITANGATYNTQEATTQELTTAGNSVVTATVTDKRGRTGTASYTMNVLDYTAPAISALAVRRCNADGTANNQGENIKATFSATATNLSGNTIAYVLSYKKTSVNTWTNVNLTAVSNNFAVDSYNYVFAADGASSYDVKITATDKHNTASRSTSASTAFTLMNWHSSGTAIGIGKVVEKENTLQVALDLEVNGDLYGRAYGLGSLPIIPNGSDIDSYVEPGCYSISTNAAAESMSNLPRAVAGRLIVSYSTGQYSGTLYDYREQLFLPHDRYFGVVGWIRKAAKQGTAQWQYGDWNSTALEAYPVGSIYLAYDHISPAEKFGGTWARIENRFLWATTPGGDIGKTGGQQDYTLTVDQMPSHRHTFSGQDGFTNSKTAAINKSGSAYSTLPGFYKGADYGSAGSVSIDYTGGGKSIKIMPPYVQVSAWRRTA